MSSIDEKPTFNLKAVVQETGLKPDTLRAWERRYGLPQPARTSGGHRLYSQRDIDILKWLMDRQEEGLSISRAVDLWRQLLAEGKDPFMEMVDEEEIVGPPPLEVGDTLAQLRESWIEACLAFDEQRAEYTLSQALALYPPETACLEVLQKGLSEIGRLWYQGEASAQQEHFASALAIRRLEAILAATPPPTRPGRILIGCPPEEEHAFSALLLTLLLRRRGWDTVYLGANVPLERLQSTIERTEPDLVILAAQTLNTAASMLPVAELVQESGLPLAFGGRVFNVAPSLQERIPGHFLGKDLAQAPNLVEQLMTSPTVQEAGEETPQPYLDALAHFRERQSHIEAELWEHAAELAIPAAYLARANRSLGEEIVAALTLGDISLLGHDLEWVRGLLHNFQHRLPEDTLRRYLKLYHEAADKQLNQNGRLIVSWLEDFVTAQSS
ncbi:MAG: MerR family transcriptional regulator [Candidatus Promineifilaceae bacterium]|nr:MerR family transcriptional regulator [Candidatus Promineifilaceae bacterium]